MSDSSSVLKDQERHSYGLLWGTRILTEVNLPPGVPDQAVRDFALDQVRRCPCIFGEEGEAPFEFISRLRRCEVKCYG